jgi:hypothetical protein
MSRLRIIYSHVTGKKMAEYKDGELVWSSDEYGASGTVNAPMVMGDIAPYISQIDGSVIESRSKHRAHLKAHNCIEIGNETKYLKPAEMKAPGGLKQDIIEQFNRRNM